MLVALARLRDDSDVVGCGSAVDGEINGRRAVSAETPLGVVVRGAEGHELTDCRAVLFRQVLVDAVVEGVGLDDALAWVAEGDLDELANGERGRGVGAA